MPAGGGRIILYGHFGSGNIGNDSSLEAMLHAIKKYRPKSDVICICNGPDAVHECFEIETIEITTPVVIDERLTNRLVSKLKKVWIRLLHEIDFWWQRPGWFQEGDKFIVAGTGAVDDMSTKHPWNAPYELYKWCSVAKRGGAQVFFVSVGVGPIMNRISRFLMLRALKIADYRSYREKVAFTYLKSVGYDTTGDLLYPDLVFSLPTESLPVPRQSSTASWVVGLGLINYYGWGYDPAKGEAIYQEYVSKIKCFVSWLLDRGYGIRIISGDLVDNRPIQEIMDHARREHMESAAKLIIERISNVNELFAQIAETDIVVASRFHNVLCSLMLGRPVISLGYHEKNNALMSEMGLGSYCQHIESFTVEKLVEQFESHLLDMDQTTQKIHQRQQEYLQLLDEQYRNILHNEMLHNHQFTADH